MSDRVMIVAMVANELGFAPTYSQCRQTAKILGEECEDAARVKEEMIRLGLALTEAVHPSVQQLI
jgi:hypothetical protein